MTKIAILTAVAVVAIASPARAGLSANGLSANGLSVTGAAGANVFASDPCARSTSDAVIAHAPPSEFCTRISGLSLGGLEGMKVMTIELPR